MSGSAQVNLDRLSSIVHQLYPSWATGSSAIFHHYNWRISATTIIGACSLGLAIALYLCASPELFAQSESGVVTGQVQDAQGAAVEGAEVTATNLETGVAIFAKTSNIGIFYFSDLHPSRYKIVVRRRIQP